MKLITLNTWGGKLFDPLRDFVRRYSSSVDVFCFQEVYHNATALRQIMQGSRMTLFADLQQILSDFEGDVTLPQQGDHGLALFVRNSLSVTAYNTPFVYRWQDALVGEDSLTLPKQLQYATIKKGTKTVTIFNLHGLWHASGKRDTPERFGQSSHIKEVMAGIPHPHILCGDFNLLPDTRSLGILEQGMRNLVKEYGITNTRTSHYTKPDKFADYVLVSPDIQVKDFNVLPDVVSDHSPLYVEWR